MQPFAPGTPLTALLYQPEDACWLALAQPREILVAERRDQVAGVCAAAAAAAKDGAWAVGFLTYEAAPAFDPALVAHDSAGEPYAWWAVFADAQRVDADAAIARAPALDLAWQPRIGEAAYLRSVAAIKSAIARGDTYQVNLTFPLEADFAGDPLRLFLSLVRAQRPPHAAFIDSGRFAFCSASPELFFERRGQRLIARPMKGTARRGRFLDEDLEAAATLVCSAKERAENVMIVDMMRNDLGRVARPGSVRVPSLFTVETYSTVHQLTSTIEAESDAPLGSLLAALFPCASITGAPKVSTTRIIRDLEPHPRGVYTGAIGRLAPGGDALFSVAIRTVTVDRQQRRARYGTGGGIVWDSDPAREYEECRIKALILTAARPRFDLIETLLWRPRRGYFLLARHLARLAASARFFARPCDETRVRSALEQAIAGFRTREPASAWRVRLRLDAGGRADVEAVPLARRPRRPWTFAVDDRPVDARDPFLCHKTTHRARYEQATARRPDVDEVLLFNRDGALTEGCRSNLVLTIGGCRLTPQRSCGLLDGTLRGALLARGRIAEAVLTRDDLARAEAIHLINGVRGIVPARHADAAFRATHESRGGDRPARGGAAGGRLT